MLGDYGKAAHYFCKAMKNFRKTKDPRGVIYCRLGMGELALLSGRKSAALKHFVTALNESKAYGFAIENCYAEILMQIFNGKTDNSCCRQLGLKLRFQGLPLNIP
jgi:hypothetical protein